MKSFKRLQQELDAVVAAEKDFADQATNEAISRRHRSISTLIQLLELEESIGYVPVPTPNGWVAGDPDATVAVESETYSTPLGALLAGYPGAVYCKPLESWIPLDFPNK